MLKGGGSFWDGSSRASPQPKKKGKNLLSMFTNHETIQPIRHLPISFASRVARIVRRPPLHTQPEIVRHSSKSFDEDILMQERECGNTGRKKDYVKSLRSINSQPLHNRSLSRNVCAPKAGHQTLCRPVTHTLHDPSHGVVWTAEVQ